MGSSDIINNQSVHWVIVSDDKTGKPIAQGSDPRTHKSKKNAYKLGRGSHEEKPHPVGHFGVQLRFRTLAEARKALQNATFKKLKNCVTVTVLVKAQPQRPKVTDNPPSEVRVDW